MPDVKIEFKVSDEQAAAMIAAIVDSTATRLLVERPIFVRNDGKMANFELPIGETAFLAIHTVNKEKSLVPAPAGDVFTAASGDVATVIATVDVMPSGPLQGTPALKLVSVAAGTGITITTTDSAGLQPDPILVDVVADLTAAAITVDEADAVFVQNA
jgi:hypothetical protein